MRLCLPTTDEQGLDARLSPHFGSAPCFTLVDSATGRVEVVMNDHARHEHGRCDPTAELSGRNVDAVVCRGLGRRALERLHGLGLTVLVTESATVLEALAAFHGGALRALTEEEACGGGHGHGQSHGHGHDHAHSSETQGGV